METDKPPRSKGSYAESIAKLRAASGDSEETLPRLGGGTVIEPDKDRFLDGVRRVAAKDRDGFADPEDVAIELGIELSEVTELVRRYQEPFDWTAVPIGKLKLRS